MEVLRYNHKKSEEKELEKEEKKMIFQVVLSWDMEKGEKGWSLFSLFL